MEKEIENELLEKIAALENQVAVLTSNVENSQRTMDEILWAQVFNSYRCGCEWLGEDVAFYPGRWAVGYQYMYVVSRILNDLHPTSILETGMGQSTRLIGSYVKWMSEKQECHHIVVEHDPNWIDIFQNNFQLSTSTEIVQKNLVGVNFNEGGGADVICAMYENFGDVLNGRKFDFISLDGPYGTNDKNGYSRFDILGYLPECLEQSFCIVLDDYERWGEKNTVELIKTKLISNNIEVCETVYKGAKDMYLICSSDLQFLCTL
jgi:hypothetical protein